MQQERRYTEPLAKSVEKGPRSARAVQKNTQRSPPGEFSLTSLVQKSPGQVRVRQGQGSDKLPEESSKIVPSKAALKLIRFIFKIKK